LDHGHGGVVLVRNPRFRPWSDLAQPAGYPDRIEWVNYRTVGAELTAVERGKADVTADQPPPDRFDELSSRYATLAHAVAGLSTQYLSLNTTVAPFTSLDARRALNYALDRDALGRIMGGRSAFVPTCQVLPPGMFGYAPYCPYTARAGSGAWTGPDLQRARRLVARSGTRGDRVVVWAWGGSQSAALIPAIVHTLDSIGYRAGSHVTPPNGRGFGEWNRASSNSRYRVSAVLAGWSADYPNPIDFLDLLLSCDAVVPGSDTNLNTAQFCHPPLDRLIHEAEAKQVRDPAGGASLWQRADREAMSQAPWAPLLNNVGTDVLSSRTGNYQHNPEWSVLLDQLWVR
jgi:peptide/nickel transport system substrate-binding protein